VLVLLFIKYISDKYSSYFAPVEYYWLLDLGFRSATVKYVAHHTALGEQEKIIEVVSTALVYSTGAAARILTVAAAAAPQLRKIFQIAPSY
jgi:O-antigen/teichoic acid export membrane protein